MWQGRGVETVGVGVRVGVGDTLGGVDKARGYLVKGNDGKEDEECAEISRRK